MHHQLPLVLLLVGLIAAQPEPNYPDPAIPCGANLGLCPSSDLYCKPFDADCADMGRCEGSCAFKNAFGFCGGMHQQQQQRRVEDPEQPQPSPPPPACYEEETCVDDPRSPLSCGMACDRAGICLPKKLAECEDGDDCPEGQWCYEDFRGASGGAKFCM